MSVQNRRALVVLSLAILGLTTAGEVGAKPNGYVSDRWQGKLDCGGTTRIVSGATFEACDGALGLELETYDCYVTQECELVGYTWKDAAGGLHEAGALVKIGDSKIQTRAIVIQEHADWLASFEPFGGSIAPLDLEHHPQPWFETECEELRWEAEEVCGEDVVETEESCDTLTDAPSEACSDALAVLEDTCWRPCPFRAMDEIDLGSDFYHFTPGKVLGGGPGEAVPVNPYLYK